MKKIFFALLFVSNSAFSQFETKEIKNAINEELYRSFCGKVYIKKTETKSLLLFFETSQEVGSLYDKSILIETNTMGQKIEMDNNDKCEVLVPINRRFIVINNITKSKMIYLGLYDVENLIQVVSSKLHTPNMENYFLGYGLSYMENKWEKTTVNNELSLNADIILLKANINLSETVKNTNSETASPGGVTCHSGGVGSSQCSVEQGFPVTQVCSVTCNVGYYACCNTSTFKCKCIVNGTPESQ